MKNLFFAVCLLCTSTLFAQEEWGNVVANEVTLKEIAPIWPGCEEGNAATREKCFDEKLTSHIIKNYKYPPTAFKNNEQGKVVVTFMINEKGLVEIKNVTGGTEALRKEAKRNILSIPKMAKPGMLAGKPRAIEYTVPFSFKTGK